MIKIRLLLISLVLSFVLPVFAQEKADSYSVVLPVENQTESQRQVAFEIALHQVVDNLNFKSDDDLSELFAHSERYVESYSYVSDPEQSDALQIVVHFDSHALSSFFPQQRIVQTQHLTLQVSGITSVEILQTVTQYLSQINVVKSVITQQVSDDNIMLLIELQDNANNFAQTLLASQHFISLSDENSDSSALRLKWIGE